MSDDTMATGDEDVRGADPLRELGKQLPYDRPDAARRDAVRSSLLVAASEGRPPGARNRWLLVAGGFAAGALAAAAVAIVVLRSSSPTFVPARDAFATIESSSAAELDRSLITTQTGTDELVRVRSGKVRLAVPAVRAGDHVRLQTGDAEVEGSGAYEVVVTADTLASVTVATGTASVRIKGQQQAVFLAAGETWRASVVTADLDIAPAKPGEAAPTAAAPTTDAAATAPTTTAVVTPAPSPAPAPATAATVTARTKPDETPTAATTTSPRTTAPATVAPTTATRPTVAARIKPDETPTTSPRTTAPATTTTVPSAALPTPTEPQPAATAPRASITAIAEPTAPALAGSSPTEKHFRAGYALLRASKYPAAALELGQAAEGDGPLAADARYFQAVALTKAGRGADAERALVQFIDRSPTSVRRGRAMIMLARLLVARGESTSARAWFEEALRDADPSVVAAARAGIAARK